MKSEPKQYEELITIVNRRLQEYLTQSQEGSVKILTQLPAGQLAEKLQLKRWIEEGGLCAQNVDEFLLPYLDNSQHMHHPHYAGHQVSVPHLISGAADFVHGSINNPMAIYEMGPSAAVIEKAMVNWMLQKVGWMPIDRGITEFGQLEGVGAGIFTHGGSMANLTAMLAARARIAPEAWNEGNPPNLVVIGSEVSHYSIARSISIMGLGKNAIKSVAVDEEERMDIADLESVIEDQLAQGNQIMAVIANACATSTGLYDNIEAMASICNRYNLWFHVDGAHGASALLSAKYRHFLKGVEYADSIIWDTHKMLRTSTLAAAVLFKNPEDMIHAFQQKGSYLFHDKVNPGFDLMPYAIECTKAPLATKLFWVLAAEGEGGLSAFVTDRYDFTKTMYDFIESQVDFDCPYEPEANILCFRYNKLDKSNAFQLSLRNEIVRRGHFYITSTEIRSIRYLRMTVINPLTRLEHIKLLIQEIREVAVKIVH